jgi:hypothetical protein
LIVNTESRSNRPDFSPKGDLAGKDAPSRIDSLTTVVVLNDLMGDEKVKHWFDTVV